MATAGDLWSGLAGPGEEAKLVGVGDEGEPEKFPLAAFEGGGGTPAYCFGGGGVILEPPEKEACFARALPGGGLAEFGVMTDVERLLAKSDGFGFICAVPTGGCRA